MELKNTKETYGLISILFHWLTAVAVIGLFALGLWMEDLDYYDPWYKTAPHWHKSIGVLLIVFVVCRIIWRITNKAPESLATHSRIEKLASKIVHIFLYGAVILMLPTGYLVTTAKGQSLHVFDWFSLPATITGIDNLESIALEVHETLAFAIIGVAIIHALAAVKHHFWDKDSTLKRMLGIS